ncbi:cysteine desulfurase mitochondrial-like [Senna tora]|uniref:Cysteine desulfurase mitochondrial-like n=1 Tax=Senna tora TaxID=362788 RepID=A0A834TLT2_9FABA|nr:cysteine desulfurase mitochondrial-like [Senna tora]
MKGLIFFELKNALRKGINLGNTKDGIYWVDYRFERVPKCCYSCGVFGHEEDDCETLKMAKQRKEDFVPRDLGPWLKAGVVGRKVEWGGPNGSCEEKKEKKGVGEDNGGVQSGLVLMKEVEVVMNANKEGGVEVVGKGQKKALGTETDVSKSNTDEESYVSMLDTTMGTQNVEVNVRTGGLGSSKGWHGRRRTVYPWIW